MPELTDAAFGRHTDRMAGIVETWTRKAGALVSKAIADTQAHAAKAITETLRETTDGRPTIAKARRSRSYQAALGKLNGLEVELGLIVMDARSELYRTATTFYAGHLPADILRPGAYAPSAGGMAKARSSVIVYADATWTLRDWLNRPVQAARSKLLPTLTAAASRAVEKAEGRDLLQTWAAQHEKAIGQAARLVISDSDALCDKRAGRDCVRPEFLDDDPTVA